MTLPHEARRAIHTAREVLTQIGQSKSPFAEVARAVLRHYPYTDLAISDLAASPDVEEGASTGYRCTKHGEGVSVFWKGRLGPKCPFCRSVEEKTGA